MIHKEDSILINQGLERVFAIARDMEKLSEFISEYKNVKILSQKGNEMELEARINLAGLDIVFISIGVIKPDESIKYEQTKGPLKGLLTEWRFERENGNTRLRIIHQLGIKIPLIGDLVGYGIYSLFIKKLAQEVLIGMKKQAEKGG